MIFVWDKISGEGVVCHGPRCHNNILSPDEVRIQVLDVDPKDNLHPKYDEPIEAGSFTAIPMDKIHP